MTGLGTGNTEESCPQGSQCREGLEQGQRSKLEIVPWIREGRIGEGIRQERKQEGDADKGNGMRRKVETVRVRLYWGGNKSLLTEEGSQRGEWTC